MARRLGTRPLDPPNAKLLPEVMMNAKEPKPVPNTIHGSPESIVRAWWAALTSGDLEALRELTQEDFISTGGPTGRTVGWTKLEGEARVFVTSARIDGYELSAFETRVTETAAVCAYYWSEQGHFGEAPFDLSGYATDVLVRTSGGWRHQAHHVSMRSSRRAERLKRGGRGGGASTVSAILSARDANAVGA